MWNRQKAKSVTLGAGVLVLSAGMAAAEPAVLETNSHFRSGPGTHYRSLAVLDRGTVVDVEDCSGRWCAVAVGSEQGYIARSLLDFAVAVAPPPLRYYGGYGYASGPYASFSYGAYPGYPPYQRYAPYGYYRHDYYRPGVGIGFRFGY